jgi:DNA-nicking Smr family endonuclease
MSRKKKARDAGESKGKGDGKARSFAESVRELDGVVPMDRGPGAPPAPPTSEAKKRAGAPSTRTSKRGAKAFRFPVADEPLLAHRDDVSRDVLRQLRRGEVTPDYRIDLHGLDRSAAERVLRSGLKTASHTGVECVLVTHGWGRLSEGRVAVIKEALPGWLTSTPTRTYVRAFAPSIPRDGGPGASYVLLRS